METRTGCAVLMSVSCSVIVYFSRKLGRHNLPLQPPESPGWGDMGIGMGVLGCKVGVTSWPRGCCSSAQAREDVVQKAHVELNWQLERLVSSWPPPCHLSETENWEQVT